MAKYNQDEELNSVLFDLMTGMMFIFIIALVAYMLAFNDKHSQEMKLQSEMKDVNFLTSDLVRRVSRELKRYGINHLPVFKSGVIRFSDEALKFESGSAKLSQKQQDIYLSVANVLADIIPCYSLKPPLSGCRGDEAGVLHSVVIEGHTDSIPYRGNGIDGIRDNQDLSYKRAKAVYSVIVSSKINLELKNRNKLPLYLAAGFGASRPLSNDIKKATKSENRRIDIRFIMAKPWEGS